MSDEQERRLADALGELEERSTTMAAAEAKSDQLDRRLARFGSSREDDAEPLQQLLGELEAREAELTTLRPRAEELEAAVAETRSQLETARHELEDRVRHGVLRRAAVLVVELSGIRRLLPFLFEEERWTGGRGCAPPCGLSLRRRTASGRRLLRKYAECHKREAHIDHGRFDWVDPH